MSRSHNLSGDVLRQISDAVRAGRKIEAIKLYKLTTGASLKESKAFIDRFVLDETSDSSPEQSESEYTGNRRLPNEVYRQITDALSNERKIEAIKIHREATGAQLRESKDFVEAIISRQNQKAKKSSNLHPGVQSSRGCFSVLAILGLLIAVAILIS